MTLARAGDKESQALAPATTVPWLMALGAGPLVWVIATLASGRTDAWEAEAYWRIGYPVLAAASGLAAYYDAKERVWLWPLLLMSSLMAVLVVHGAGTGRDWDRLPLAIIAGVVPAVPLLIPAYFGRWVRQRRRVRAQPVP